MLGKKCGFQMDYISATAGKDKSNTMTTNPIIVLTSF